jgi:hypothetical protein
MPKSRALILALAIRISTVLRENVPLDIPKPAWRAWGIPEAVAQPFIAQVPLTEEALRLAEGDGATDLIKKQCTDAFKTLEVMMRALHKYFYLPGFDEENLAALGLKPHDRTPSNHPAPEARPVFTAVAAGDGKILVKVEGTWPDNAEGVKYYWEITDEPDSNPANLRHSTFKNKLRHEFVFDAPDWGKKISLACAFENGKGDSGPLSAIVSRNIP